jgi:neutral ceramidase
MNSKASTNNHCFRSTLRILLVLLVGAVGSTGFGPPHQTAVAADTLKIGVAEKDITPPEGFPIAGYYHERLATGTTDPLKAKAIVFRDGPTAAALVVCDLGAIAADLSHRVREQAAELTGIPRQNIAITGTHSHTAPDYFKDLHLFIDKRRANKIRGDYIESLIVSITQSIVAADAAAIPVKLSTGLVEQQIPVSFNRRFVMKDGSVKTWSKLSDPQVVRAAGPIDPQISILRIDSLADSKPLSVLSNFALHLDTVGGTQWSADYPYFIEQSLRTALGNEVVSVFATGPCGDINHSDPSRPDRNKTDFIGNQLGATIVGHLDNLQPLETNNLRVESAVVELPLEQISDSQLDQAVAKLTAIKSGEKIDFYQQVEAYKHVMLSQFRPGKRVAAEEFISWGLTHDWRSSRETLPAEVQVISLGSDVAIVCLPGEVFVELGLAIKQGSPFKTTIVVELSNCAETLYIPNRGAYAQGGYEVTNSALSPGAGEMLIEASLTLLRRAAE